jgi:histidinol-phosphate aminotransferase
MYERLKAARVLVRFFDSPGLNDKLRVTIGTPDENEALLRALDGAL